MSITATITAQTILVADRNDAGLVCQTFLEEARPATFELADLALATVSMVRTEAWELDADGNVSAQVTDLDNTFNGVVAARLDDKIGTTHGEIEPVLAETVANGDLITDREVSALYVVAGGSLSDDIQRVLMVADGKGWNDRHAANFGRREIVWVARKR
jgi:hypothetical protein